MRPTNNTYYNRPSPNLQDVAALKKDVASGAWTASDENADTPLSKLTRAIATPLLAVLRAVGFRTSEERDIAIAKQTGARDFNTRAGGGTVRNVMKVEQAYRGNFLRAPTELPTDEIAPQRFSESGLTDLITGREYLAITHGEGPDARTTVILNDSVDKTNPTALVIQEPGRAPRVLMERDFRRLFKSPEDRIVLGPIVQHRRRDDAVGEFYHEQQTGNYCPMHAINALAGRPVLSKSEFDTRLIEQRKNALGQFVNEDQFYLNSHDPDLDYLYDLDAPLPCDVMTNLMRNVLGGEVETANPATLLHDAARFEKEKRGLVVLSYGHYVAFRRGLNPATGRLGWCMIDSGNPHQVWQSPTQYLHDVLQMHDLDNQHAVIGWSPRTRQLAGGAPDAKRSRTDIPHTGAESRPGKQRVGHPSNWSRI